MNYHDITKCDMKNGDGMRVVLWVSGCNHACKNCQNPQTWDPTSGIPFVKESVDEILDAMKYDYISGLTITGGDPLFPTNREDIYNLLRIINKNYPDKTIWMYTGYTLKEIINTFQDYEKDILEKYVDVLVDGPFMEAYKDVSYPWAGSTNQKVIDLKKTFERIRDIKNHSSVTFGYDLNKVTILHK